MESALSGSLVVKERELRYRLFFKQEIRRQSKK